MAKMMEPMTFTGWVIKMFPAGDYDQKFTVANYRNEDMLVDMTNRKELPNCLQFSASVKNGCNSQLDDVHEGDKITVKFYLHGKSGISKKTGLYYCINNLNIAKNNGIIVVEKLTVDPSGQPQVSEDDNLDIPF